MAAIAAALPYISAAASAISVVSSLAGGKAGSDAAGIQAAQLEDERANAATQAKIDEAERRKELSRVLATSTAIRSERGGDLYSDTFRNLQDVTVREAQDDIDMIQLNSLNRQRRYGLGIDAANAQGRGAMLGGVGGALGGLGKPAEAAGKIK